MSTRSADYHVVYTIEEADLVALALRVAHRSTVCVEVDGSHRAGYMQQRHGVTVEQADEALADPDRLVLDPDYASRSGRSVRTIGWSEGAGRLVTDTTVTDGGGGVRGQRLAGERRRTRRYEHDERAGDGHEQ